MCGIAGFVGFGHFPSTRVHSVALAMGDAIAHRGPDGYGVWLDESAQLAFVHRRLAIQDLSEAGHQPMTSASGRFVIAYNGEIYNHLDLREELERVRACSWRGHSDTETLLAGIEAWGIEATLQRAVGMFAIALWDKQDRVLYLGRDRLGEKPLYYGWQDGVFMFASELKSLRQHPAFRAEINRDAVALQMRHNYIPAPHSIYRGISKLMPGNLLQVRGGMLENHGSRTHEEKMAAYWSLDSAVARSRLGGKTAQLSDEEMVNQLDTTLRHAIRQQMLSDVPLGAFLSGGVDSSAIVALMQAQVSKPVKTFTIGFDQPGYNEAEFAKAVAKHLGTEHSELYVTARQALDVVPRLPSLYDEPFSDSSQIPTLLVAEMAKRHVTVALSGDAGDELFGGYSRYPAATRVWQQLNRIPAGVRRGASAAIRSIPVGGWNAVAWPFRPLLPAQNVGDKAHKFSELLGHSQLSDFYRKFVSHWGNPSDIVIGANEQNDYFANPFWEDPSYNDVESLMLVDSHTYLPDDILVKVDRAAMGVSLETRVPFLDHRVVELAWQFPHSVKVRDGQGKWILREVLYKYVPRELIERPKMGFAVPIGEWLRGPLREWAEGLLSEERLRRDGIFNPAPIRQKWAEHVSGKRNWQYLLWDVLVFQAWAEDARHLPRELAHAA